MLRLHSLWALSGRRSLRYQRSCIIFRKQILCHILHSFLVLANLLVNVFDLTSFSVSALSIVLLNFLHFDTTSLILLRVLSATVLLELLTAAVSCKDLRV